MKTTLKFCFAGLLCFSLTLSVPVVAISMQNGQAQNQRRSLPSPGNQHGGAGKSQYGKISAPHGRMAAGKKKTYYLPGTRISVSADSPGLPKKPEPRTMAKDKPEMPTKALPSRKAAPGGPIAQPVRKPVPSTRDSRRAPTRRRTSPLILPLPEGKAPAPVTIPLAAPPSTVPASPGGSEAKQSAPPVIKPLPTGPAKEKQPAAAAIKGSASEEGKVGVPETKTPVLSVEPPPVSVSPLTEQPKKQAAPLKKSKEAGSDVPPVTGFPPIEPAKEKIPDASTSKGSSPEPGKAIPVQKSPKKPGVRRDAPPVPGLSPTKPAKEKIPDPSTSKDSGPEAGKAISEVEVPVVKTETVGEDNPDKIIVEVIEPGDSGSIPVKSSDK